MCLQACLSPGMGPSHGAEFTPRQHPTPTTWGRPPLSQSNAPLSSGCRGRRLSNPGAPFSFQTTSPPRDRPWLANAARLSPFREQRVKDGAIGGHPLIVGWEAIWVQAPSRSWRTLRLPCRESPGPPLPPPETSRSRPNGSLSPPEKSSCLLVFIQKLLVPTLAPPSLL